MLLRDLLNKIIWDPRENRESYEVTFVHRGVAGDIKRVSMSKIVKVERSWFTYLESGDEQLIPLHRVLSVTNRETGKILWSKS